MKRLAAIQMDIESGNKEKNLEKAVKYIKEAAKNNSAIVCLPELFTTGFIFEKLHILAEDSKGKTITTLASVAEEEKIIIIAGSIVEKMGNNIFNTTYVINSRGKIEGIYRKNHLFPLMNEDKHFKKGDKITVIKLSLITAGFMICYDIRFPELARLLALNGAELIFIPSEFPNPRLKHWRILLQARAVENQCYVVGVNRVGKDITGSYFGHTMIIDPWGEIVAEAGDKEEIIYGEIDGDMVKKVRKKIPCFQDRREDVYSLTGNIQTERSAGR